MFAKKIHGYLPVIAFFGICLQSWAAEPALLLWSGKASSTLGAAWPDNGAESMASFETRLILETQSSGPTAFRAEFGYDLAFGAASTPAVAFASNLAASPDPNSLPPGTDLHGGFSLKQAYASVSQGPLWCRFGFIPAGSGASWLYNPTSRMGPLSLEGDPQESAPGIAGVSMVVSLPLGFSLETSAFAEPRKPSSVPELAELAPEEFPLTTRLQYRGAAADFSLVALRERLSAQAESRWWFGADLGFDALGASWYAEGAARAADDTDYCPSWLADIGSGGAVLETSAGLSYDLPLGDIELRSEYLWFSSGGYAPSRYNPLPVLRGETLLMGRSYLFVSLERTDPVASRWSVTGGLLANADDRSGYFLGELKVTPVDDFEIRLGTNLRAGNGDGEFNAAFTPWPGAEFRPWVSSVSVGATAWF